MDKPIESGWTLVSDENHWRKLNSHLFPGDFDEHGAIILAGAAEDRHGLRLLVREVVPAIDGKDYLPGNRGYRALDPQFIAAVARRARDEGWIYLAAHNHGGTDGVRFSSVDLESHKRGYPALIQITGRPVGAIVLAESAVAGELWLQDGSRASLNSVRVIGRNIAILSPQLLAARRSVSPLFDRQARLFGEAGQRRMADMRISIVGLGGAGSMAAEMLARLGVGELLLIDPDRIEASNLSRVVGSTVRDLNWKRPFRQRLKRNGPKRASEFKVDIAARFAKSTGLPTSVTTFATDVADSMTVPELCRSDWIVLAADSQQARHVVNAIVNAFLIPAVQIGVKIPVDAASGAVGEVFAVARRILPGSGCLWCNGLIDPTELQLEAIGDEGVRARAYVGMDAPAPSVISLNGLAVAHAITDLMLSEAGLLSDRAGSAPAATYARFLPRVGRFYNDEPRRDPGCGYCGDTRESLRARGRAAALPLPLAANRSDLPTCPRRSVFWKRKRP